MALLLYITLDSSLGAAHRERPGRQNVERYLTVRRAALSVFLLTVVTLGGCASFPLGQDERAAADAIATPAGMLGAFESAGGFDLLTYRRGIDTNAGSVHVYIEGDGRAWRARRAPRNPTPYDPMGLRLAAKDPAPAVLWIARPCMYLARPAAAGVAGIVPDNFRHFRHPSRSRAAAAESKDYFDPGPKCDPKWWTSHRYAAVVVDAINTIISRVVGPRAVTLIGHSGGGALAALAASRRDGVAALITVSSPLDLTFWAAQGAMTPLHGSLNPIDVAHLLAGLPQRHLVGEDDRVVPPEVVRRFFRALPKPNQAQLQVQPGRTHQCCWERDWPQLLAR